MSTLTLTLRQPTQIADRARSDNLLPTLLHVPGWVLRGAFAAAWLARNDPPEPGSSTRARFLALFEGGVRYGPLFRGAPFLPLSVLRHKYAPEGECKQLDVDLATRAGEGPCPHCQSPREQVTKFRDDDVDSRRRASVAIGAAGVALRGQLFTRDSLTKDQVFTGEILADDPTLLAELAALGPLRVGGRRTTHGLSDLRIDESGEPPTPERIDETGLIIRLASPAVFIDSCGRPLREPEPRELTDVLGVPAVVERRWTRWQSVGGWHGASGLPKPTELAVAAGSTYVVRTAVPVDRAALVVLARRGLGIRRHEGFGHLAPVGRAT